MLPSQYWLPAYLELVCVALDQLAAAPGEGHGFSSANKDETPAGASAQPYLDGGRGVCDASHPRIVNRVSRTFGLSWWHVDASPIAGAWLPVA